MDEVSPQRNAYFYQLFLKVFADIFGDFDMAKLEQLLPRLRTVELHAGEMLMREGEASDAMYVVLSGRLRAMAAGPDDAQQTIGEIGRGEVLGEMGIIMGTPRSASVQAIRDSVLVRLAARDFEEVLLTWPHVALPLARTLLRRQARSNRTLQSHEKVVNVCVLPITPLGAPWRASELGLRLSEEVAACLAGGDGTEDNGGVAFHDSRRLPAEFARQDWERSAEVRGKLSIWLDQEERSHAMQIFVADHEDTPWTRLCIRHADRILLLADAGASPRRSELERRYLGAGSTFTEATQSLWLLQQDDCRFPSGTRHWLAARDHLGGNGDSHYHLRAGRADDWARLARILTGNAIGLVFAGGGARGFSQLGVMQALQEQGIAWDQAGGTSIGAVMAAYAAMDLPWERVQQLARKAFSRNPTGDFAGLPVISLLRGHRLASVIHDAVAEATGQTLDSEDLWKPFFCIASNYSLSRQEVLHQGPLAKMLTASVSIPAALPPVVWNGHLLTDGGTFNNYPADVMRKFGAAKVIGVYLRTDQATRLAFDKVPGPFAVIYDRYFRRSGNRRFAGVPSLPMTVVGSAVMASVAHARNMRQLVDLQFTPDVTGIGMLEWTSFDRGLARGLSHARELIARPESLPVLDRLRGARRDAMPDAAGTADSPPVAAVDDAEALVAAYD